MSEGIHVKRVIIAKVNSNAPDKKDKPSPKESPRPESPRLPVSTQRTEPKATANLIPIKDANGWSTIAKIRLLILIFYIIMCIIAVIEWKSIKLTYLDYIK